MRSELASGTSLSASRLDEIVEVCDRFEAAWRVGTPRTIEHELEFWINRSRDSPRTARSSRCA
jgi:hypothetical protein